MTTVSITSLDIFQPALAYHQGAHQFLSYHAQQITARFQPLSDEIHKNAPQHANGFDKMIATMVQRLSDEASYAHDCVNYLLTHRQFLADAEAKLAGQPLPTFPELPNHPVDILANITKTTPHSCWDEFQQAMKRYEHDLYSFDQHLQDFENRMWIALNRPDDFHLYVQMPTVNGEPSIIKTVVQDVGQEVANWTTDDVIRPAIDFIHANRGEIYTMIDTLRRGYEFLFLPVVDGIILQDFLDYITEFQAAYQRNIQSPFDTSTRPIVTQYQPPANLASYHHTWASVPDQQHHSAMALDSLVSQLQSLQATNETITIAKTSAVLLVVGILAAIVASVFIVSLVVTIPDGIGQSVSLGGVLAGLQGLLTAIGGILETLVGILVTTPIWFWVVTALATTAVIGVTHWTSTNPLDAEAFKDTLVTQGLIAALTTLAYTWVKKTDGDGNSHTVRKLTDNEVKRLKTPWGTPFEQEKASQGGWSTDDIYVDEFGDYWIGRRGSNHVDPFP